MSHEIRPALNIRHVPLLDAIPAPRGVPPPERKPSEAPQSGDAPLASATTPADTRRKAIVAANRGPVFTNWRRQLPPDDQLPPAAPKDPPPPDGPDLVPRTPRPKVLV